MATRGGKKNMSIRVQMNREKNWLGTLFKKAYELSVLTDSKVAILLNSSRGERHEFVSPGNSMKDILECYVKHAKPQKVKTAGKPEGNGLGMPPNEDSDIPPLEDNTPDDMTHENLQPLKLTKSDMHMIVDSYTNEEIKQFEQQLEQAMISLLKRKVEMVEEQVKGKRKMEMFLAAAADTQLAKESPSGARDSEDIRFEVGSTSRIMEESPSGARDNEEIQFFEVESTSRIMEESTSGARDSKEIQFFEVGSTSGIMEVGSSSSGCQESKEVELQDMELDLELCLGSSYWR